MNFDSAPFLFCFLPVLLLLYCLLPGRRAKNVLLLLAGFVFCAAGSLGALALLLVFSLINYLFLIAVRRMPGRKLPVAAGVVFDLLFLCFFKYLTFLVSVFTGGTAPGFSVAAPLGVSFFTFRCISCLIDVYRAPGRGAVRFFDLLLYVSFFPQLAAGPIARFPDFEPQLAERTVTARAAAQGMRRFIVGLGKKLFLSAAACRVTDAVFALDAQSLDFRLAWVGAIAYTLQIYFDFSGYSDMAIGTGEMLGFRTAENFDYPYVSHSVTEFWRRWHISLSSWFRDYLYIPLGGNRRGRARTALNKYIVFVLCGLWHGASWNFVLWGAWHGVFTVLESAGAIRAHRAKTAPARAAGTVYTLLVVCIGFVMFRAPDVGAGARMIAAMFSAAPTGAYGALALRRILTAENLVLLIAACVLCAPVKKCFCRADGTLAPAAETASYVLSFCLLALCIAALASGNFAPFIYFQF